MGMWHFLVILTYFCNNVCLSPYVIDIFVIDIGMAFPVNTHLITYATMCLVHLMQ